MRIHLPADQEQECKQDPGQHQGQQPLPFRARSADHYSSAATIDPNKKVSTYSDCIAGDGVDQFNGPKVFGDAALIAGLSFEGLVYQGSVKVGAGEQRNGGYYEFVSSSNPDGTIIDLSKLEGTYENSKHISSEPKGPSKVCAAQHNGPVFKFTRLPR